MTLKELEAIEENFLSVDQVAEFLCCAPQAIRVQADTNINSIGFPVTKLGTRIRIPKEAFLFWYKYGHPTVT
jgi:hypothetical protein